jgi:hypothetical protein
VRRTATCLTVIFAALLLSCQDKSGESARNPDEGPFVPTADSSLTALQVERWLSANKALDSVARVYQDSFRVDDAEKRQVYQEQFLKAQGTACLQVGMRSYDEYKWITQSLANPRNAGLRESLKISALP